MLLTILHRILILVFVFGLLHFLPDSLLGLLLLLLHSGTLLLTLLLFFLLWASLLLLVSPRLIRLQLNLLHYDRLTSPRGTVAGFAAVYAYACLYVCVCVCVCVCCVFKSLRCVPFD